VVVGAGESGADIVAEVAAVAAETVLSLRRGVSVLPRRQFGYPNDYQTCRLTNSAAPWIAATRDPADRGKRRFFATICLPFFLLDRLLQDTTRLGWELLPLFHPSRLLAGRRSLAELRLAFATRRETARLLAESHGTFGEQFGTKSDEFVRAIAAGRCRRAGAIERFAGSRVIFADGGSVEADLVILATGFVGRIPFLDAALAGRPRYLRTFVPEIGAGLAFVGFLRPALGAIPPLAELQARWFARLLSDAAELPTPLEMHAEIECAREFRRRHFRAHRERLDELVDFTSVCDALARQIGCQPTRRSLAGESRRFRRRFFAGPFVAAQYRLRGPHARPELTRRTIEALPVALPPPRLLGHALRWAWSRLFGRLFGPGWAPKLELPET
jgi:dimethylaniline monooxygenase (N-oxide forming)